MMTSPLVQGSGIADRFGGEDAGGPSERREADGRDTEEITNAR